MHSHVSYMFKRMYDLAHAVQCLWNGMHENEGSERSLSFHHPSPFPDWGQIHNYMVSVVRINQIGTRNSYRVYNVFFKVAIWLDLQNDFSDCDFSVYNFSVTHKRYVFIEAYRIQVNTTPWGSVNKSITHRCDHLLIDSNSIQLYDRREY